LYFENDLQEASPDLLAYVMGKLGYDLFWHPARIFDEDNFFGNPVNHWAPKDIVSLMVLGIPSERKAELPSLRRIVDRNDWWQA
jgi:hypothetical protein